MKPRWYQQEAVDAVYDYLRVNKGHPLVEIPTGGGKTPVIGMICRDAVNLWNGKVLLLAHVKELLEQGADKIKAMDPTLPVGVYSAGLKRKDLGYSITVAGIQSVHNKATVLGAFDLILIDECFVAGTMISTPAGDKPIEEIQPGMYVHNATGIGQVFATSAKQSDDLVTLELSDGTEITCTHNHPVFTNKGWRQAGSMEIGSVLYSVEEMRMLQQRVSTMGQNDNLRNSESHERISLEEAKILFNLMLEDPRELHERPRGSRSCQRDNEEDWTQTENDGREREATNYSTANAPECARGGLGFGAGSHACESETLRIAEGNEAGSGKPESHDCDRDQWREPQDSDSKKTRHKEDNQSGQTRLVRRTHHQRNRIEPVFNLQVTGHPSYFANGRLVHNCHLIPFSGDGMYLNFINEMRIINPRIRVIGLTATPYRMKGGMIVGERHLFDDICYTVGVKELMNQGFLSKVKTKSGVAVADTSGVKIRAGEFQSGQLEDVVNDNELVRSAVSEIIEYTKDRRAVLGFVTGEKHGKHVLKEFEAQGITDIKFVTGKTPAAERDAIAEDFKAGRLKYLLNINIFTTGFDATIVDCVAMLRPTASPGLYYQMVGRGFRLHPGKEDCLVLDFGGNVMRHGPVDAIQPEEPKEAGSGDAPAKECPECHELIHAGYSECPECGHVFPVQEKPKHDHTASTDGIISGEKRREVRKVLEEPMYFVHTKRGAVTSAPRTLRVDYQIGFNEFISEWVCLEHEGWAAEKASQWWRERSNDPRPVNVDTAVKMAADGCLAEPEEITIEYTAGEKWPNIVGYKLHEKPEAKHRWASEAARDVIGAFQSEPVKDEYEDNGWKADFDLDIPF